MSNNALTFLPRNVVENVINHLDNLITATSVKSVLEHGRQIWKLLHCEHEYGIKNFFKLKSVLLNVKSLSKWNRVASILKALDQKTHQKEYAARHRLQERKILVIGGGLSGLRVAIELLLIGANVICVEKRDEFSRNNVIHLWPNVINDMCSFEAKRLYGQFCVGSIDHISIRQLQLILLKISVIYGVKFAPNVAFEEICPRIIEPSQCKCIPETCNCCCHSHGFGDGAYAHFKSPHNPSLAMELNREPFDTIIGCDGRRNTFSRYFPRNNRRGKLAIGLTANFVNRRTEEEAHCPEISGISRIYNQKWFKDLHDETGIDLENLVYYRDETHYFVMTATKASLVRRGVLRSDCGDSHALLHTNNIDISMLMKYSKDAAEWSSKLRRLEFALNSSNKPDVALFDFTSMYSATNASCAKKTYLQCCSENPRQSSKYTLMLLCGDSLLEPFWPTGSGAGRGFLSALDAAWTVSLWYKNECDNGDIDSMLNVISQREYVYRLLAQTSPENTTNKNFTLDPQTRYKNLNLRDSRKLYEIKNQVRHLIIDKNDLTIKNVTSFESKRARRATVGINSEDVLKARNMTYKPVNAFDDFNEILPSYSANKSLYAVPSNGENSNLNCDNLKVIELKAQNFVPGTHVDYKPRNDEVNSNYTRKDYQARNHFLNSNFAPDEILPERSFAHDHQRSDKENYSTRRSASHIFDENLNDRGSFDDDCNTRNFAYNDLALQCNRNASSSIANKRDFLRDFVENNLPPNRSNYHDQNSVSSNNNNNRSKKSLDIIEKAQYLEQKFEEQKKPYIPKLAKVGKIEDEDWNVKMWNSTEIFAAKIPQKRNMVHDNSKALLQSRITQLNNNFNSSNNKDDILSSASKNKITNEYVHLLSNEVSQKLGGSNSMKLSTSSSTIVKVEPVTSVKPLNVSESTESSAFKVSRKHTMTDELLKPSGECKRCSKTITAIDRVSVLGQNFHKSCLTCKSCSIMLRQDEIANDAFICKVCIKSRTYSTLRPDARSSFFDNQLSVSLIEAKKNFLVNIEQIDLRERAEFEIVDESDDSKTETIESSEVNANLQALSDDESLSPNILEVTDDDTKLESANLEPSSLVEVDFEEDAVNQCEEINKLSSQSDISESDSSSSPSRSDTNYTDDERSESDELDRKGDGQLPSKSLKSFEEPLAIISAFDEPSIITANESNSEINNAYVNGHDSLPISCLENVADTNNASNNESDQYHRDIINNDACDQSPRSLESNWTPSFFPHYDSTANTSLRFPSICMTMSYPNSDSSLVIEKQPLANEKVLVDRTFGSTMIPNDTSTESKKEEKSLTGHVYRKAPPPPRYSGQFTEKFYRTLSQPTLYEQLNLIDQKLKRSTLLPPSHEDLPFADSHG